MFKFTIRELLLLAVIVAMGAAWCVDHRHATSEASVWEGRAEALADRVRFTGKIVNWIDDHGIGISEPQSTSGLYVPIARKRP